MTVRGTFFNNRVNNPIANVTVATNNVPVTPGCAGVPTCRQLQNLGSTNIAGFQTDVSYRVNGHWGMSGAYVFDIAKVHESTVDAAGNDLTGKYLAEVPKHRVSFQVNYTNPRYVNVAIENQFVGHQFDDDLNTAAIFPGIPEKREVGLPKYNVTNLTVVAHDQSQRRRVLRRAEPVRDDLLRRHQPDDDRHAAAGEWRDPTERGAVVDDSRQSQELRRSDEFF